MRDIGIVILNEWMKMRHRLKIWLVFGMTILLAIGFSYLSFSGDQNKATDIASVQKNDLAYNTKALEKIKKNGNPEEIKELEKAIKGTKQGINTTENILKGNWKPAIQKQLEYDKAELENAKQDKKTLHSASTSNLEKQIAFNEHYLKQDEHPLLTHNAGSFSITESTAYSATKDVLGLGLSLLLPLMVILIIADIVSDEATRGTLKLLLIRPISRTKILFGKWIVSILVTALLAVIFFTTVLLTNFALYGTFGAHAPQFMDVSYIMQMVEQSPFVEPQYSQATLVPISEALFYGFLHMLIASIAITSLSFLFSTIFASAMISTAIPMVIVVAGSVLLSMSLKFPFLRYFICTNLSFSSTWLESTYASMSDFYLLTRTNITMTGSIMILLGWIVVPTVIAFIHFRKKDILNA
ncbi:ABC-type transport system involved in multi-copper enzyme maturation, permease component [Thermoactinomyces sp. DSM 45891]|uniref:ABC transporter permease subunit n=1 Tax=Thermoactinomyces sp. DSM 45891 TaxID=1761907 RepID=UPI000918F7B8|nr:ABC transporter permease subunit [Thermoactinomyces sp. DSM 45891]SFX21491.1 ABC-type transport system involved in multi-copper enzyme maturation, permease component [Thermoactinomyces sp. DSM 45891]